MPIMMTGKIKIGNKETVYRAASKESLGGDDKFGISGMELDKNLSPGSLVAAETALSLNLTESCTPLCTDPFCNPAFIGACGTVWTCSFLVVFFGTTTVDFSDSQRVLIDLFCCFFSEPAEPDVASGEDNILSYLFISVVWCTNDVCLVPWHLLPFRSQFPSLNTQTDWLISHVL